MGYPSVQLFPNVIMLTMHLEDEQRVYYREDDDRTGGQVGELNGARGTTLTAYFIARCSTGLGDLGRRSRLSPSLLRHAKVFHVRRRYANLETEVASFGRVGPGCRCGVQQPGALFFTRFALCPSVFLL